MKITYLILLILSFKSEAIMRIAWNGFYETTFTDHLEETTTLKPIDPKKSSLYQCIQLILRNGPQEDIYLCLLKLQRSQIANIDLSNLQEVTQHYKNLVKETFEFLQRS